MATTAEARRIRAEALPAEAVADRIAAVAAVVAEAAPTVAVVVEAAAEAEVAVPMAVAEAITETDFRWPEPKCPPKPN